MGLGPRRNKLNIFLPPVLAALSAVTPARADGLEDAFRNGHFFGELRYRYEDVLQDGNPHTAQANTVRADLGFETGLWEDFTAHADYQVVRHIGADDFNDADNGNIAFPTIADPDRGQFREGWLMWTGLPDTEVKGGRQDIKLDNQRFIGDSDFRQSDVTFDAGTVIWSPLSELALQYTYIWNINRVTQADWQGNTNLLHAAYDLAEWLRLSGYAYFIDINQAANLSSQTWGAQVAGAKAFDNDFEFDYLAEYARQSDYAANPDSYDLDYWHVTPSLIWKDVTLQAGYESLGGNGTDAVQTPLATLHWFNGWADAFLTTPANGLDDRYGRVSYRIPGGWLAGAQLEAFYHDFRAERTSAHYGTEWDFAARRAFEAKDFLTKEWTVAAEYATYRADSFATDRDKFWLTVGTKF